METLVANLTGSVRRVTEGGVEYLVAPLTLIVPGVLNGSQGALYYPPDEISRNVEAWNGVPLHLNHPQRDGRALPAKAPGIWEDTGMGVVRKARIHNGRLKAEGWFEAERTKRVSPVVYAALFAGKPVELSTGLYTRNEPAPEGSVFNDRRGSRPYTHVARDYTPDHVAVLPDQIGACSLSDGCGVLMNTDKRRSLIKRLAVAMGLTENIKWTKGQRDKLLEEDFAGPGQSFPIKTQRDVDDAATLVGKADDPEAVKRRIISIAKKKGFSIPKAWQEKEVKNEEGHGDPSNDSLVEGGATMPKMNESEKKAIIDALISNCEGCGWLEKDRPTLNSMDDEVLLKLQAHQKAAVKNTEQLKQEKAVADAARAGFSDVDGTTHTYNEDKKEWVTKPAEKPKEEPVSNKETKKMTAEEWLAQAPPEVREDLAFARNAKALRKQQIIDRMTVQVPADRKEVVVNRLREKSLEELEDLSAMVPQPRQTEQGAPLFTGAAGPMGNRRTEGDDDEFTSDSYVDWSEK